MRSARKGTVRRSQPPTVQVHQGVRLPLALLPDRQGNFETSVSQLRACPYDLQSAAPCGLLVVCLSYNTIKLLRRKEERGRRPIAPQRRPTLAIRTRNIRTPPRSKRQVVPTTGCEIASTRSTHGHVRVSVGFRPPAMTRASQVWYS